MMYNIKKSPREIVTLSGKIFRRYCQNHIEKNQKYVIIKKQRAVVQLIPLPE